MQNMQSLRRSGGRTMGQLVYLPAGVAGPDPDAFLSDV